jgi:hypothetical protein
MMDIKPGDWVRFYNNGHLVIGKVEYVSEDSVQGWKYYLNTDQGRIEAAQVLEIRNAYNEQTS